MQTTANPIFVALDGPEEAPLAGLARALAPHVGGLKIGKEAFTALGPEGLRRVVGEAPLFLDLKFHDIPNTVAGAVAAACRLKPAILNVHAAGGPAMLAAARAARDAASRSLGIAPPLLIAVTVLTSLDAEDLAAIGVAGAPEAQVLRLAKLTAEAGLDGVVCSPCEIAPLRAALGPDFKLVVPGIRPAEAAAGDQKRVMSPAEALAAGADYLVIGRPITAAPDPAAAARAIARSLEP